MIEEAEVTRLHEAAMAYAYEAMATPDRQTAAKLYRLAFENERRAAEILGPEIDEEPTRSILFRSAATLAYDCQAYDEVERLVSEGLAGSPPPDVAEELRDLRKKLRPSTLLKALKDFIDVFIKIAKVPERLLSLLGAALFIAGLSQIATPRVLAPILLGGGSSLIGFVYLKARRRIADPARSDVVAPYIAIAAAIATLVPILISGFAFWNDMRIPKIATASGIPKDFQQYGESISELKVGCGVNHLRWVPKGLIALSANCSQIKSLVGIPDHLSSLGLSLTTVESLDGIPKGIEDLDVSSTRIRDLHQIELPRLKILNAGDIRITDLRIIPRSVSDLTLRSPDIVSLEGLPELRRLTLAGTPVGSLKLLPHSLRELSLQRSVRNIDSLPPNLETLETDALPSSGTYPASLRKLIVLDVPLESVPPQISELELRQSSFRGMLPPKLKALRILGGTMQLSLSQLPSGLKTLSLTWANKMRFMDLPPQLEELNISYSSNVISLTGLRPDIKTLDISKTGVASLQEVPSSVERLTDQFCELREAKEFPPNLRLLDLSGCENLELIENLPQTLEELNLRGTAVSEIKNLPAGLKKLDISDTRIKELENLPPSLSELIVTTGQIKSLKGLPKSVRTLAFVAPSPQSPFQTP